LRRDQPPVNFGLNPSYPLHLNFVEAEAHAPLSIANSDDPGRMMHAVDDDITGVTHRASGDDGDAI
jgi:hypothetical protein